MKVVFFIYAGIQRKEGICGSFGSGNLGRIQPIYKSMEKEQKVVLSSMSQKGSIISSRLAFEAFIA